jgi:hypothetical protein
VVLGAIVLALLALVLVHRRVSAAVAASLVCDAERRPADALVLDNLDASYALFKRASALEQQGLSSRVLIASVGSGADGIDARVVDLMAHAAGLRQWEIVSVHAREPISLHAAREVAGVLRREGIRSIALVTPGFRSRRSTLVYQAVLAGTGIAVRCEPTFGGDDTEAFMESWHGLQEVALQFLKLQYYRFYVLPRAAAL